ncbi:1-phosphofructokinase [Thermohalobacter berrensis]|uniref:Tagatose-6-phosphate kinase n=1 Tax=Thermohalobacter berrensis TaxID=99594 RepID=A0A419T3R9_9FIRM|nr:1-phosphofructokinase [Thermohalobacter berrensis]RKD32079.1 1-phosphofructokinase [Thermohalobacter berrensis]
MVITVTLNPALDKTIQINNFTIDSVNRVNSVRLDAGGKGINVSKVIKELGGYSIAVGLIGGKNGQFIKKYLDNLGIENDFIELDSETRTNIKIIDPVNQTNTDINESGPVISEDSLKLIKDTIMKYATEDNVIVFSGSVPKGVGKNIYKDLILDSKKRGAKTILDTEGELFLEGIKSGPYLVKPNIHELEKAFKITLRDKKDIVNISKEIIRYGVNYVVVSLGSKGSIFVSKDIAGYIDGIKVNVKSTVGAGDSMVAALALALDRNDPFEEGMKLAAATSTASVMTEGSQTGRIEDVKKILNKIRINYI